MSVEQHCRTAGILASLVAAQCPSWLADKLGIRAGAVLAALHDIGKVTPGFQRKCPAWVNAQGLPSVFLAGTEEDHAKVGQQTLQELLIRDDLRFWAAIVGAHHGRLKGDRLPANADGDLWAAQRRRLLATLTAEFGPLPDHAPGHDSAALWFNAGLIAVADWLASDDRHFPPSKTLAASEIRQRAERQLRQIGMRPGVVAAGKRFADLFAFPPNALQTVFADAVRRPGIYVVEAAMGCGKTEAALIAAYNLLASGQATGVYFALPTQVTSNRVHRRVAEFIGRLASGTDTRLIHGGAWLLERELAVGGVQEGNTKDREGLHDGRDWFASSRRALLAPFGVGTVDQALLGVVAAKHFFVRQFALAGKVVILDEIHSYDLYTGTLLDKLVIRLRELGATVIVLSATLTAARRRQLLGIDENTPESSAVAYPLLSACTGDGGHGGREWHQVAVPPDPPKTVQVRFRPAADLADACLERADRGECVLWIRNTVNDAQDTYRQLKGRTRVGGPEIALLHARFPQFRREDLENEWLERLGKGQSQRPAGGCVLVSTQVAEQSVDIDADLLITDLAPADMLLQRLGRLWRHPRRRPVGCAAPEVWVALPALEVGALYEAPVAAIKAAFGKSAKVYAPYVLLRTFLLWRGRTEFTLPADIRPLLEATYAESVQKEPEAWGELREALESRKRKLQQFACANSNPWQLALDDEEGVQTRWNSCPTASMLLVRTAVSWDTKQGAVLELLNGDRCELRAGEFDYGTAKALHRNLVKVPRWCVRAHLAQTPRWLGEYIQGDVVVGELTGEKLLRLPDRNDTGLAYRADLGVVMSTQPVAPRHVRPDEEEDDDESYD